MPGLVRCAFITMLLFFSGANGAQNVTIGTGDQSGTYYPLGGLLAKLWNENLDDFNMRVEVTAASAENLIKVARKDQLVGFSVGDTALQAYKGEAPFPEALSIAKLFALYPSVVYFVVSANSDIHSIDDLRGRKVSLGAPGSGTKISALKVLEAQGISQDDILAQSLGFSATTNALANGQIDAGVIVSSLGVGAITELALTRDIRMISFTQEQLDKVTELDSSYEEMTVPAQSFHNVPEFAAPVIWNLLVVNQDMDEKLAYQMTKVVFDHRDELRRNFKITESISLENMDELAEIPLHPGARKYLLEQQSQ